MDDVSKYRLTGAFIWLGLLVFVVPTWYSNPVDFQPHGQQPEVVTSTRPLVEEAFVLPMGEVDPNKPIATGQPVPNTDGPDPSSETKKAVTASVNQSVVADKKTTKNQWIVRLIAYNNAKDAKALVAKLESNYPVKIKEFKKTGVYSVRVGPYSSLAKAEQDKQKLDKMLKVQSRIIQLH